MTDGSGLQPVVSNQSMVLYSSAEGTDSVTYSNTVNTLVVGPVLSLQKQADRQIASLGETLVYTVTARNSGNTGAVVTITDVLPPGVSFVANSVLRDGVPLPGITPSSGIPLGILAPHSGVSIAFQVIVISLPPSLALHNRAVGTYSFNTPEGRAVNGEIRSNPVSVSLLSYQLSSLLSASTPTTFIGDVVTYTLQLRNEGTLPLTTVIAMLPVPEGTSFLPGSVIAGGIYQPEADPASGIGLGSLPAGAASEVSYRVRVTLNPPGSAILANAQISYQANDNRTSTTSNTVQITVIQPGLSVRLKVDLYSAAPGDNLRYEFIVNNSGNLAVNALLTDAVPPDVLFVWDSVRVDGIPQKGLRPGDRIPLGTLRAGAVAVVDFLVSIPGATDIRQTPAIQNQGVVQYTFSLPDGRNVGQVSRSNAVTTLLFTPIISIQIQGEPPVIEPGGIAEFNIQVSNSGNYPAEVSVIRIVPQGTVIDPDIVTISATVIPGTPYSGTVALGTLQAGQTVTLTYFVKINTDYMGKDLQGSAAALYVFTIDGRRYSGEARSNTYKLLMEEISE
ncbi:DUF11 domain-containing protein [Paenibacillus sp. FSL P4-0338]|uniref:DUF11 domain-containing protein n=1 Tax=unclassified Paenibacillus TaxID=185978 RepID=UPI0003E28185|nr:DUF11 domain-containing protein [Paenibacillus sp. FSL R7-269]ETT53452.1 hypothetical protein C162_06849 [Paenibacillus sp. FSL R7-269]